MKSPAIQNPAGATSGEGSSSAHRSAAARGRLEAQLAELETRQKCIAADLSEPLNPDSSEQAVEMEDDAGLEGEAVLVAREIASVERALARIADGIYGRCVRCGTDIAPARLDARPEAALCIDCAREA
jgi:RNA polymerase-binding transcription factor DksA